MAECMGGGAFRFASAERRIGSLGLRIEKRIEYIILAFDHLGLRLVYAQNRLEALSGSSCIVCAGLDGEADACDPAICIIAARLLATATDEVGAQPGHEPSIQEFSAARC